MKQPNLLQIATVIMENRFKLFSNDYSVNLGGIRTKDNAANTFNDWLYAFYHINGKMHGVVIPATTDPGLYYRLNPMRKAGTAMIVHNRQYFGVYQLQDPEQDETLRGHKGKKAFRQIKEMDYWRDPNRDKYLDLEGTIFTEIAHTNIHDMGTLGRNVNKWSAGCPGAIEENMDKLFEVAEKQIEKGLGDKFSFTLLHEELF